jgi:diguanylate cyclase (GGDEF)-like protein
MALAERVRLAVEATTLAGTPMESAGPVTVSIGLAVMPDHARDLEDAIQLADRAMYSSKHQGRNRSTVWNPTAEAARAA